MNVLEVARAWRERLQNMEDTAVREAAARYLKATQTAENRLRGILTSIETTGRQPTVTDLFTEYRLATVKQDLTNQLAAWANGEAPRLRATIDHAVSLSPAVALEMVRATIIGSQKLPPRVAAELVKHRPDETRQIIAALTKGSSLHDLLLIAAQDRAEQAIQTLVTGVALNRDPRRVAGELGKVIDGGVTRARTIVRTEMLRASREAQRQQWQTTSAVKGWAWFSSLDKSTCPICWAMHGTEHELDEAFGSHPNCFPAGTVVVPSGRVNAATSRPYAGELVTIRTASGDLLTGTPNHPVATSRGWVTLNLIQPGDQVFHRTRKQVTGFVGGHPDNQAAPSLIEQVAESLRRSGDVTTVRMPTTTVDFHGDGSNGQVDVVFTASLLGRSHQFAEPQLTFDEQLVMRDVAATLLSGLCPAHKLVIADHAAPGSRMRGGDDRRVLLGGSAGGDQSVLCESTSRNAGTSKHSRYGRAGHTERFGEREFRLTGDVSADDLFGGYRQPWAAHLVPDQAIALLAAAHDAAGTKFTQQSSFAQPRDGRADLLGPFPADVTLDRVTQVDYKFGSLHVYNLETSEGWYSANNIIVHNCRCSMIPIVEPRRGTTITPAIAPGVEIFESLPAVDQIRIIGRERHARYLSGEFKLQDVVGYENDPRWGPTRKLKPIR